MDPVSSSESEVDKDEFTCIICSEVFLEPVRLACGHIFDRGCLEKWVKKKQTCPCCRAEIPQQLPPLDQATLSKLMNVAPAEFEGRRKESAEEENRWLDLFVSHSQRNAHMLLGVIRRGILLNNSLLKPWLTLPRSQFLPPSVRKRAYGHQAINLQYLRCTVMPAEHAVAGLEALSPEPGHHVLLVDSLLGHAACICMLAVGADRAPGTVTTLDSVPAHARFIARNIAIQQRILRPSVMQDKELFKSGLGYRGVIARPEGQQPVVLRVTSRSGKHLTGLLMYPRLSLTTRVDGQLHAASAPLAAAVSLTEEFMPGAHSAAPFSLPCRYEGDVSNRGKLRLNLSSGGNMQATVWLPYEERVVVSAALSRIATVVGTPMDFTPCEEVKAAGGFDRIYYPMAATDATHVSRLLHHLKDGGRLVTIQDGRWQQFDKINSEIKSVRLPREVFCPVKAPSLASGAPPNRIVPLDASIFCGACHAPLYTPSHPCVRVVRLDIISSIGEEPVVWEQPSISLSALPPSLVASTHNIVVSTMDLQHAVEVMCKQCRMVLGIQATGPMQVKPSNETIQGNVFLCSGYVYALTPGQQLPVPEATCPHTGPLMRAAALLHYPRPFLALSSSGSSTHVVLSVASSRLGGRPRIILLARAPVNYPHPVSALTPISDDLRQHSQAVVFAIEAAHESGIATLRTAYERQSRSARPERDDLSWQPPEWRSPKPSQTAPRPAQASSAQTRSRHASNAHLRLAHPSSASGAYRTAQSNAQASSTNQTPTAHRALSSAVDPAPRAFPQDTVTSSSLPRVASSGSPSYNRASISDDTVTSARESASTSSGDPRPRRRLAGLRQLLRRK